MLFQKKLIDPQTNQQVLAKWPTISLGEIYAEKISSLIGNHINIPVMQAEIGMVNDDLVVLGYNFLDPGEELIEGGDFFDEYDRQRDKNNLPPNYTFQKIKEILKTESLLNQFIDMLLFDCLIFNTDRHQDNWGLCINKDKARLAPAYDNSSSLGFNLSDEYLERMYNDPRRLNSFIEKAKTHIGWIEPHPCKHRIMMQNLKQYESKSFSSSMDKIAFLTEHLFQDIVNDIPNELMSDLRKEIVTQLLLRRRNLMVEMR